MRSHLVTALTSALVLAGVIGTAQAQDLLGATVRVTPRYPDRQSVYQDAGSRVVSNSRIEYPEGSFPAYNPAWEVDVEASRFVIAKSTSADFAAADFNGFVLESFRTCRILRAEVDSESNLVPIDLDVINGVVYANFQGLQVGNPPLRCVINLIFEDACPGDLTGDGIVAADDLGLLIAAWGTDGSIVAGSDLDGDGIVRSGDLGLLLANWGPCQ